MSRQILEMLVEPFFFPLKKNNKVVSEVTVSEEKWPLFKYSHE